jgi:hypothetical protein
MGKKKKKKKKKMCFHLNFSPFVLHHFSEHAKDPEKLEDALIRKDWVVSLKVMLFAKSPTDFVQLAFVLVLSYNRDFVWQS